jgi:hypothetical protein
MTKYCVGLLAVVCLVAHAGIPPRFAVSGDHPQAPTVEEPATTINNVQPIGPGDFKAGMPFSPTMWIGVKACGEYVIWLVFDGHISVVDQTHHPKDMKEFMHALENSHIPHDERMISCTGASL